MVSKSRSVRPVSILGPLQLNLEPLHANLKAIHGLNSCLGTGWIVKANKPWRVCAERLAGNSAQPLLLTPLRPIPSIKYSSTLQCLHVRAHTHTHTHTRTQAHTGVVKWPEFPVILGKTGGNSECVCWVAGVSLFFPGMEKALSLHSSHSDPLNCSCRESMTPGHPLIHLPWPDSEAFNLAEDLPDT